MKAKILNVEQGSAEWFNARLGRVTASRFADVISKGRGTSESQTRRTYMLKLIAERITGELMPGVSNEHTARGHEHEPIARAAYEFATGNDVMQAGIFVCDERNAGFSPDGLVGADGIIEIKSKLPHLHLDCLLRDEVPSAHMAQIQGGLWLSERQWCDFISYCPGLPLFVKRVQRDEEMIERIKSNVEEFNYDMDNAESQIRAMMDGQNE